MLPFSVADSVLWVTLKLNSSTCDHVQHHFITVIDTLNGSEKQDRSPFDYSRL